MKLAVIIPTLNEESNLERLFSSIDLTHDHVDFVVADAAKSNDNAAVLCKKNGVSYIKCNANGRAVQMNIAYQTFDADVYMFLHADVIPPIGFYEHIVDSVHQGFQMGFFAYNFSPTNRLLDINASFTHKDGIFAGGGDQCQFFTKDVLKKVGGYDIRYVIMEDFAMMRTIRRQKIPYTIIQNKAIVSSRKYENNSYLWVNAVNFFVYMAFLLGVSPLKLKKIYSKALSK